MNSRFISTTINSVYEIAQRSFSLSASCSTARRLTRFRVVDNSPLGKIAMTKGKPPKMIGLYKRASVTAFLGDKITVAIEGQVMPAVIVGETETPIKPMVPRFDTNNIVLLSKKGDMPLGKRILVPIPLDLRRKATSKNKKKRLDYTEILAIATRFV